MVLSSIYFRRDSFCFSKLNFTGLSWRLVNSKYPFHVMHNLGQAGMARRCRVAIAKLPILDEPGRSCLAKQG